MRKLKYREITEVRQQLLQEQNNRCALTQQPLTEQRAVLDHCHTTGQIRGVLDRGVNALLGRIENNLRINRIDLDALEQICHNLIDYIKHSPRPLIHPRHRPKKPKKTQK